ncbi:Cathepsin_B [Hexamita inflata]|uniref:Cathepsin B n=1 Tax=Hexamita inflata TaxID=28002 RepID=A0AA86QWY3_9EUKA|nr:Cathepsin B [Hexamita inflata]
MLFVFILTAHEEVVTILQNIPGITWTAKVYENIPVVHPQMKQRVLFAPVTKLAQTSVEPLPDHWDWVEQRPDCVDYVSSTGMCGVDGILSAANMLGSQRCLNGLDPVHVDYSAQFMLNCDTQHSASQCEDLVVQNSEWSFLIDNGTVPESCVSYKSGKTGKIGKCPTICDDQSKLPTRSHVKDVLSICNYQDPNNEQNIMRALMDGPVQTRIQITEDFLYYNSGIYKSEFGAWFGWVVCEFVGYGVENGVKFWKVKNEMSRNWGENGYFRIVRGTGIPWGQNYIEEECYQIIV